MRYSYAYKTSDGIRHEGTIDAPSRDEAFAALRKDGIKPIKVVAADGSKANGEVRGVRRRVVAAVIAGAALAIVGIGILSLSKLQAKEDELSKLAKEVRPVLPTSPRHQIYGDPDIVGAFERGQFDAVLSRPGDRLLAWFAQPGKLMAPSGLSPNRLYLLDGARIAEIRATLAEDLPIVESDSREVRELKQIVNGLHEELREYLANGVGTVQTYWQRQHERYRQEVTIYNRIRHELEGETRLEVWEEKNDALRRLGLRTIPHPPEIAVPPRP